MLILIPIPVVTAGVETGETVAIINLDFNIIKSIEEVVIEGEESKTKLVYISGATQSVNIKFTRFMEHIMESEQVKIPNVPKVKAISKDINSLLSSLEANNLIKYKD